MLLFLEVIILKFSFIEILFFIGWFNTAKSWEWVHSESGLGFAFSSGQMRCYLTNKY